MIRGWIRRSFRNRMFVTVLLATLLPLLLCGVLMMQVQLLRSEAGLREQAEGQLAELERTLEDACAACGEVAAELADSTVVRSALRRGGGDSRTLYQVLFRTTAELREMAQFDIYDSAGSCYYTTGSTLPPGALDTDWGVLYAAGQAQGLVFRAGEGNVALTAARTIRSYDGTILGYVVVTMTQGSFDRLFGGLYTTTSEVLLLDPLWQCIYYSQPALAEATVGSLRRQLLAGERLTGAEGEYQFFAVRHRTTGFSLLLQQPLTFTSQVMASIYTVSALMVALCLLLCLWCAWALSRHLSQPIHQLDEAMGEVEKGHFDVHLETGRADELGRLANSFNRMAEEYRLNLERSVQRQRELNETQLRMMQAQLNPHFLYNTLDSMKWLGVTHQVPQVATLATDLATILRAGISGDEIVTLERELELIERYIDIQLIRFEDRFTCEIDITEQFQSCLVPKLVLQPLVENAIIHGVADREEGYIKLWAEEEEGDLLLSVSDNGCGIPPETLERLNSEDKRIPGGHLGLFNVDSIVRLHFGAKYGISARSVPGEGSCVRLRLPIEREEKRDAEGFGC